jgi:hypothetical protein
MRNKCKLGNILYNLRVHYIIWGMGKVGVGIRVRTRDIPSNNHSQPQSTWPACIVNPITSILVSDYPRAMARVRFALFAC